MRSINCLCDMYKDMCVSVVVFFKFIRSIYNFNRMDDHTLHWRGAKISCELRNATGGTLL